MTSSSPMPHKALIESTLPSWFVRASPEQRRQLTESMVASHACRARLARLLNGIQSITEFARPRLAKALDDEFGPGLDPEKACFFHARFERDAITGRKRPLSSSTQPLLQAALHNYEAKEARAAGEETTSAIYDRDPGTLDSGNRPATSASPRTFIELCRRLDLGGRYQAHLNSFLDPAPQADEVEGGRVEPVKALFVDREIKALQVAAHIARMTHMISEPVWRMLLSLDQPGQTLQLNGKPVGLLYVKMLGVQLRGVVVFQARSENRCVVYMPSQPQAPLQEYPYFGTFMEHLREKSRTADYRKYLEQRVPLRSRALFFARLEDCLNPYVTRDVPGSTGPNKRRIKMRVPNPSAHLRLEKKSIGGDLCDYLYLQQMLYIKDDARALAVPTGDEDERSRKARLAGYLECGLDVLNLAGFFIPTLGQALLLIEGGQLLAQTIEGVEALTQGQMSEALGHFSSVAEGLATAMLLAKVEGLVDGQAFSVKPSSFIGRMEPVSAPNAGNQRLRLSRRPLGTWTIRPGFKVPTRLADGRLGYLLSGRGQGAALWQSDPRQTLFNAMRELFPEAQDIQGHIQGLLISGESLEALTASTRARLQDYEGLRGALEAWAEPEVSGRNVPVSDQDRQARRNVADVLCRSWRYNHDDAPQGQDIVLLESLNLAHVQDLPELPSYYSQIRYLTLRNVMGSAEQFDSWVRRFNRISRLEIVDGGLTALPGSLSGLEHLHSLSVKGQGLIINQQAMNLLMDIPRLGSLNLSGNTLGSFSDISRLRLRELRLSNTGLTQWPQWVDGLNLRELDISDNGIRELPVAVTANRLDPFQQTVIFAHRNPINLQDLRACWLSAGPGRAYVLEFDFPAQIRVLSRPGIAPGPGSSTGVNDLHSVPGSSGEPASPRPVPDLWCVEGRNELNSRIRSAWQRVQSEGDAPHLLILLQRLRETPDFLQVRESLTHEVVEVLQAAARDSTLRDQIEVMANDRLFGADQTCQDGVRLVFSDIQVAVYAHTALQGVATEQQTEQLLEVVRKIFRLNEAQLIADQAIAHQEALGLQVDHAEVRMAYRTGLAARLALPGQPSYMAWRQLSNVTEQAILDARRLILEREAGPDFLEFAVNDRLWNTHLRVMHGAEIEQATASVRAQMEVLEEQPPADPDEYDRQGRALIDQRNHAEEAMLKQLTDSYRQAWQ